MDNNTFQVVAVVSQRLIPINLRLRPLKRRLLIPAVIVMIRMLLQDPLSAQMAVVLQQLVVIKVEILKVVLFLTILALLIFLWINFTIVLRSMVYLIIFNMEQRRIWYAVAQLLMLHRLEIHFKPFQMD